MSRCAEGRGSAAPDAAALCQRLGVARRRGAGDGGVRALIGPGPSTCAAPSEGVGVDHVILFQIRLPRILLGMPSSARSRGIRGGAPGAAAQPTRRAGTSSAVSGGARTGGVRPCCWSAARRSPGVLQPLGAFAGALLATMLLVPPRHAARAAASTLLLSPEWCATAVAKALIMFINSIADFYQAHGIIFWPDGSQRRRELQARRRGGAVRRRQLRGAGGAARGG